MPSKKGRKVPQLKRSSGGNSLEPVKNLDGYKKKPGQTGLHAPDSIDAIRKPRPDQRKETGEPFFGGVSEARISEQTYDCYKPIKKTNASKKKK